MVHRPVRPEGRLQTGLLGGAAGDCGKSEHECDRPEPSGQQPPAAAADRRSVEGLVRPRQCTVRGPGPGERHDPEAHRPSGATIGPGSLACPWLTRATRRRRPRVRGTAVVEAAAPTGTATAIATGTATGQMPGARAARARAAGAAGAPGAGVPAAPRRTSGRRARAAGASARPRVAAAVAATGPAAGRAAGRDSVPPWRSSHPHRSSRSTSSRASAPPRSSPPRWRPTGGERSCCVRGPRSSRRSCSASSSWSPSRPWPASSPSSWPVPPSPTACGGSPPPWRCGGSVP